MDIRNIFYNEFGRVRSGLRFTIFLFSFFLTSILLLTAAVVALSATPFGFTNNGLGSYVLQFGLPFLVAVFFGCLYGKIFEDLPFRALGCWFTKNWLRDLLAGLVIGAVSIGFAALIAFIFNGLSFRQNESAGSAAIILTFATSLLIFVFGAAFEEAFFRGYLLQTLSRAKLVSVGIILTSLLFATMHNGNPGANPLSWLNTFLAGIWLAAAYFKTRNLWLAFGIHLTWNWFQGTIFGINVSGLGELATAPLMNATDSGPQWLTGGDYGIEGGIACTIALIASTALIYFLPFIKPTAEMLAFSSREKPKELRITS